MCAYMPAQTHRHTLGLQGVKRRDFNSSSPSANSRHSIFIVCSQKLQSGQYDKNYADIKIGS